MITALGVCVQSLDTLGHHAEAVGVEAYLVEVLVLAGRHGDAWRRADELLIRMVSLADEVVHLTTRRLRTVAAHLDGRQDGLDDLSRLLDEARAQDCAIEIARCLQALEALSPVVDPAWAEERAARRAELGVVWMPPVTFAPTNVSHVDLGADRRRSATDRAQKR